MERIEQVRADNGTRVKWISQNEVNDIFEITSDKFPEFIEHLSFPRSMEVDALWVGEFRFPLLVFESFHEHF